MKLKFNSKLCVRWILLLAGYTLCAMGISIMENCHMGMLTWDGFVDSLAQITGIHFGYMEILAAICCIAIEWIILKNHFKKTQLLEIPFAIVLGLLIEYFTVQHQNSLLILLPVQVRHFMGLAIRCLGVALILSMSLVMMAMEGVCMAIYEKWHIPFYTVRIAAAIGCLAFMAIGICFFQADFEIGWATIADMLLYAPLVYSFYKPMVCFFYKAGILGHQESSSNELVLEN